MTCSCSSVFQPQMRTDLDGGGGWKAPLSLTPRLMNMSSCTCAGMRKEHKTARISSEKKATFPAKKLENSLSLQLVAPCTLSTRCKRERRRCRGDSDVDVWFLRSQPLCRQQNQYSILLSISILQVKREGLCVTE